MASIIDFLATFCSQHKNIHTYVVGYSGGLDSHVLLHVLATIRKKLPIKIKAIHIHHGLSLRADAWSQHCAKICEELSIDFCEKKIVIPIIPQESVEALAREMRYTVLAAEIDSQQMLMTAHHADDQAETVLLQMLRGAGPKGLAAMPLLKKLGQGSHARPFLYFNRSDLHDYAQKNQLTWIEDDSNDNLNFSRNFLRHEIMPLLKKKWPAANKTLNRVAENCAEMQCLVDEIALGDMEQVRGTVSGTLSVSQLLQLPFGRQRQVLRYWLQSHHFPIPSLIKLRQIQQDMLLARQDKSPYFSWQNIELRRYRGNLYALRMVKSSSMSSLEWDFKCPIQLPNKKTLIAELTQGKGIHAQIKKVAIHFRQEGEKVKLPGRQCHHTLKKLLQSWGVPPWERSHVPLIFLDEILIAAVGFFQHEDYQVGKNELGYVFSVK